MKPSVPTLPGRSIALVIGIDTYQHIKPLRGAVPDATAIAEVLRTEHHYEVELLVETEQTTWDSLRKRLTRLVQDCQDGEYSADDRFLFYFAGHGFTSDPEEGLDSGPNLGDSAQASSGALQMGPVGYFIPNDAERDSSAKWLPMQEVYAALKQLPCRHQLIALDCCFAGAFRWASQRNLNRSSRRMYIERFQRYLKDDACYVLASAAFDERAMDVIQNRVLGVRPTLQHSVHSPFAYALIEGLRGAADLAGPGMEPDGIILIQELSLFIELKFRAWDKSLGGKLQRPTLWSPPKKDKGSFMFLRPADAKPLPTLPLSESDNPYRGLAAYESKNAPVFFGRREHTSALLEHVLARSLTVLVGFSGSGKSSMVQAGLIPALRIAAVADPSQLAPELLGLVERYQDTRKDHHEKARGEWFIPEPVRPARDPWGAFSQLCEYLEPAPQAEEGEVASADGRAQRSLMEACLAFKQRYPGRRALLVLDQMEELITSELSLAERTRLLDELARFAELPDNPVHLVLTLRSDFETHFAVSSLSSLWIRSRFKNPPMNRAELREIIVEPAHARVMEIEPDELIDELVEEVADTPGALPLLSFTLSSMYVRSWRRDPDGRRMTREDYVSVGGVQGALSSRASEIHTALRTAQGEDDAPLQTLKRLFLRMVSIEAGELVRRRLYDDEILYFDPVLQRGDKQEQLRIDQVKSELIKSRLVVSGTDGSGQEFLEPAHDKLVLGWPQIAEFLNAPLDPLSSEAAEVPRPAERLAHRFEQLRQDLKHTWRRLRRRPGTRQNSMIAQPVRVAQSWRMAKEQTVLPVHRSLTSVALEWYGEKQRQSWRLWDRDARLEQLYEMHGQQRLRFSLPESEFLLESMRVRKLRGRLYVGVGSFLILLFLGLAIFARVQAQEAIASSKKEADQRTEAERQRNDAESQRNKAEEARREAEKQKLVAIEERERAKQAQAAERNAREEEEAAKNRAEDSARAATESKNAAQTAQKQTEEKLALLYEQQGQQLLGSGEPEKGAVYLSEAYRLGNISKTLRTLLSVSLRTVEARLPALRGVVGQHANFSPDGQQLAIASSRGLGLFDLETGAQPMFTSAFADRDVTHSPDGTELLLTSASQPSVLVGARSARPHLGLPAAYPSIAAFSPDGSRIVLGAENSLHLYQRHSGMQISSLKGPAPVTCLVYSPDGLAVFAGFENGAAVYWYTDGTSKPVWLTGHTKAVVAVDISQDKRLLVTGSLDQTTRLWFRQSGTLWGELPGRQSGLSAVRFIGDKGTLLVTTAEERSARLWDTFQLKLVTTLDHHLRTIRSLAVDKGGNRIATGGDDGWIVLWDARSGRRLATLLSHSQSVTELQFSQDNQRLVSTGRSDNADAESAGNGGDDVELWDVSSGGLLYSIDHDRQRINGATFCPDARCAVTGTNDGTVHVWKLEPTHSERTAQYPLRGAVRALSIGQTRSGAVRLLAVSEQGSILLLERSGDAWNKKSLSGSGKEDPKEASLSLANRDSLLEAATLSSDGTLVVVGSGSGNLRLLDADTGKLLTHITAYANKTPISSLTLSQDGRLLVSAHVDGAVRVWARFGQNQLSLRRVIGVEPAPGPAIAFHPSRKQIAIGGLDRLIHIVAAYDGEEIAQLVGHQDMVLSLAYSADGERLVSGSKDQTTRVWDLATRKELLSLRGHRPILSVGISPDPKRPWVLAANDDGAATIWSIPEEQRSPQQISAIVRCQVPFQIGIRRLVPLETECAEAPSRTQPPAAPVVPEVPRPELQAAVTALARFTEKARNYLSQGDPQRALATVAQIVQEGMPGPLPELLIERVLQRVLSAYHAHVRKLTCARFSPDGTRLLTGYADGTVQLWDAKSRRLLSSNISHSAAVQAAAYTLDGTKYATASSDGTASLVDAQTGARLATIKADIFGIVHVSLSQNGSRLLTMNRLGQISVWSTETLQPIEQLFHTKPAAPVGRSASRPADTPDQTVDNDDEDDSAKVDADAEDGEPEEREDSSALLVTQDETASAQAEPRVKAGRPQLSPDGKSILMLGEEAFGAVWSAELWSVASGQRIARLAHRYIDIALFSSDGSGLMTINRQGGVRVWSPRGVPRPVSPQALPALLHEHFLRGAPSDLLSRERLARLRFSSDRSQVRVQPLYPTRPARGFYEEDVDVNSAHYSSDGRLAVIAGEKGMVRVWDPQHRRRVAKHTGHQGDVNSALFSSDDTAIVTAGDDGTVRIWNARGPVRRVLRGHQGGVAFASFSRDGNRVVSAGVDATVRIWNAHTGQPLAKLRAEGTADPDDEFSYAGFSSDGTRVLGLIDGKQCLVWNAESQKLEQSLTIRKDERCTLSPDGLGVAVLQEHQVVLHRSKQPPLVLKVPTGTIRLAGFSISGTELVVTSTDDDGWEWHRFDLAPGREGHRAALTIAPLFNQLSGYGWNGQLSTISPDSSTQLVGHYDSVSRDVVRPRTTLMRQLGGHGRNVIAWNPDGTTIIADAADGYPALHLVATSDAALRLTPPQISPAFQPALPVALRPGPVPKRNALGDENRSLFATLPCKSGEFILALQGQPGQSVLVAGQAELKLIQRSSARLVASWPTAFSTLPETLFSTDCRRLVNITSDGMPTLITLDPNKQPSVLALRGTAARALAIAIQAGGGRVAVASADGVLRTYDAADSSAATVFKQEGLIDVLAFASDDRQLIAASDQSVMSWNLQTGQGVRLRNAQSPARAPVLGISVAANAPLFLLTGRGRNPEVWSTQGKLVASMTPAKEQEAAYGQMSADGRTVLFYGDTPAAEVWDVASGRRRFMLSAGAPIGAARINPDATALVTLSWPLRSSGNVPPTEVSLWDLNSGLRIESLPALPEDIQDVRFTTDSRSLLLVSSDEIQILPLTPPASARQNLLQLARCFAPYLLKEGALVLGAPVLRECLAK